MLYLPPGVPHHGTAVDGPCMTYSVGFRAPSLTELLASVVEDTLRHTDPTDRYTDPGIAPASHPGWIGPADLERVRRMLERSLLEPETIALRFGRLMTERRRGDSAGEPEVGIGPGRVEAGQVLRSGVPLVRNPTARWAWADPAGHPLLFADGHAWVLPVGALGLASLLAGDASDNPIDREALRHFDRVPEAHEALLDLLQKGLLSPAEEPR